MIDQTKPEAEFDLLGTLKKEGVRLRIHLTDKSVLEGAISDYSRYDLLLEAAAEQRYWVPKHSVVYAELIPDSAT